MGNQNSSRIKEFEQHLKNGEYIKSIEANPISPFDTAKDVWHMLIGFDNSSKLNHFINRISNDSDKINFIDHLLPDPYLLKRLKKDKYLKKLISTLLKLKPQLFIDVGELERQIPIDNNLINLEIDRSIRLKDISTLRSIIISAI